MALRRRYRALLGLAVGLGLLVALELGLRVLNGAPDSPQPFLRARWSVDGPAFVLEGDRVVPDFQGSDRVPAFPREPRTGKPRVFVLGGSSIRGGSRVPIRHEAPGRLAAALTSTGRPVEVINLGRPGLDSHHTVEILRQSLAFGPDLIVIYMGHNDLGNAVLEDRYGTVSASLAVRLRLALGRLATYALLRDALEPGAGNSGVPGAFEDPAVEAWQRGVRLGVGRACGPDDPRRALAARDLRSNLEAMAALALDAGAGVVMVTPVSNWVSAGPVGRSCPELLPAAAAGGDAGGTATLAEAELEDALSRRPGCPELLFERGLLRSKRGDPGAYDDLRAAMEGDVLPLRATRTMTDAVRAAASSSGAALLDLEAQAEAEHGAPPPSWFVDVVHLSAHGHLALAAALEPVVAGQLGL